MKRVLRWTLNFLNRDLNNPVVRRLKIQQYTNKPFSSAHVFIYLQNGREYRKYIAAGENNTWTQVGNDIHLDNLNKTLFGGVIDVSNPSFHVMYFSLVFKMNGCMFTLT